MLHPSERRHGARLWPHNRLKPLLVEPDIRQILADEMARRDAPAPELRRGRDDAVPPQQRHRVSLGELVLLKAADDLRALLRIGRQRLTDEKRVEKAVGRAREVDGREIGRDIFRQLDCRIVVEIALEILRDIEIAGIDDLLPFEDRALVLDGGDADLAPAVGEQSAPMKCGIGMLRTSRVTLRSCTPASARRRFASAREAAMSCENPGKATSSDSGVAMLEPGRMRPPTYLRKVVLPSLSAAPQRSTASDKARRTRASLKGGRLVLK